MKGLAMSLTKIAQDDVAGLIKAQSTYGDSWKCRGGAGAFFVMCRKWDRIENEVKQTGWDIFKAGEVFSGKEGILDDLRDLRRYLMLIEDEILQRDVAKEKQVAVNNPHLGIRADAITTGTITGTTARLNVDGRELKQVSLSEQVSADIARYAGTLQPDPLSQQYPPRHPYDRNFNDE